MPSSDKAGSLITQLTQCASTVSPSICISTIAERYHRDDYQRQLQCVLRLRDRQSRSSLLWQWRCSSMPSAGVWQDPRAHYETSRRRVNNIITPRSPRLRPFPPVHLHIDNRRTLLSRRLPADKCVSAGSDVALSSRSHEERCRASKTTGSWPAGRQFLPSFLRSYVRPFVRIAADLRLASRARRTSRYSARSNCHVFNNDVNERCVSRVRWARPTDGAARPRLGSIQADPAWRVADSIKDKSDLSLCRQLAHSHPVSLRLTKTDLSPVPIPMSDTDRPARVPCLPSTGGGRQKKKKCNGEEGALAPSRVPSFYRKGVMPLRDVPRRLPNPADGPNVLFQRPLP